MSIFSRPAGGTGLQAYVPHDHPMRLVKRYINHSLVKFECELVAMQEFESAAGRPCPPLDMTARASLLRSLYDIRSDRQLLEQVGYNLLFRWFIGFEADEPVWPEPVYAAGLARLHQHVGVCQVVTGTLEMARHTRLIHAQHFPNGSMTCNEPVPEYGSELTNLDLPSQLQLLDSSYEPVL